jgi:hypothetical protein
VVVDPGWAFAGAFVPGGNGNLGIPVYTVLNRELEVAVVPSSWLDEGLIDSLLDEPIPPVEWPLP